MNEIETKVDPPWLTAEYFENRRNFPPEELLKYSGLYIAWSLDGREILASGATMQEVDAKLVAAGVNPANVVGSYVPPADEVLFY